MIRTPTTKGTGNKPKAIFMAGAAGSGKSYIRKNDAELKNLPVIDADSHKATHPDYDPKNPGALHGWSSELAMRDFYKALGAGQSFIYDGTGTKAAKYIKMIEDARAAGFEIEVVYVKVTLKTSLRRNAERERTVPEYVIYEQHDLIPTSMILISEYADNIRTIRND